VPIGRADCAAGPGFDWDVFDLLRVRRPKTLPVVLSTGEVREVLSAIRIPVRRMALTTIYGLGLRLGEGLRLESGHIDGQRLLAWVRDGKGGKGRAIPLPRPLYARLRQYWKHERPASATPYLFVPERGPDKPFDETTLQKTFTAALRDTSICTSRPTAPCGSRRRSTRCSLTS
jgi:integrase